MTQYAGDACDASQIDGSSLCTYDLINRATFIGQEEIDGQTANHFHFSDPLVGVDMADHDIWMTPDANPVVLKAFADFHPFGTWQANVTTQYIDFQGGTPPPAVFEFTNQEYCYQGSDSDCRFWNNIVQKQRRAAGFALKPKKHHHKKN